MANFRFYGGLTPDLDKSNQSSMLNHTTLNTRQVVGRSAKTSDCSSVLDKQIQDAIAIAKANLLDVISLLESGSLSSDMQNALWIYFRDPSKATAAKVAQNLRRILTKIDQITYECEDSCSENVLGYCRYGTVLTGIGHIHLCKAVLNKDPLELSYTIIHEGAHFMNGANDTFGYYHDDGDESAETVKANSNAKLELADSYNSFVKNWKSKTPADRADARGDLSGINLSGIVQSPSGAIDLNGKPKKLMFSIKLNRGPIGLVEGVSYRWSLRDSQDRAYLLTNSLNAVLQDFKPASESVNAIINVKTRELLRERGVKSGRVLCRAQSPVFGDKLFELQIVFL